MYHLSPRLSSAICSGTWLRFCVTVARRSSARPDAVTRAERAKGAA